MRLILLLGAIMLTGCSNLGIKTYAETMAEVDAKLAQGPDYSRGTPNLEGNSSAGITGRTINTASGGYMVIRSGSTTSVIQTSRSRR